MTTGLFISARIVISSDNYLFRYIYEVIEMDALQAEIRRKKQELQEKWVLVCSILVTVSVKCELRTTHQSGWLTIKEFQYLEWFQTLIW